MSAERISTETAMKKILATLVLACALPLSVGVAQAQHHGGGFRGGFHGGCCGVFIGDPYYDPFWGPYYYGPYAAAYPPPGYSGPAPAQSWYYCADPQGYYPYVQSCKSQWQAVPASPPQQGQ